MSEALHETGDQSTNKNCFNPKRGAGLSLLGAVQNEQQKNERHADENVEPEGVLAKFQISLSRSFTDDDSELGSYKDGPHNSLREQCTFSSSTRQFLSRYSQRMPIIHQKDGSETYFIPLHGITSRMLPGQENATTKFFHSTMAVTVPEGADNMDQCTFKRGPRQEESKDEFLKGIAEELTGAHDLPAHKGPLTFFAHGAFAGAGTSDNDALRIAMLSGVPTVNIDWRSTPGPWYTLPFRYPIDYRGAVMQEKSFEPALDTTFDFIGPQKSSFVSFSRGTGFDATYMQHRFANRDVDLPIAANILAHADLLTSVFKERQDGINPIVEASPNTIVLANKHDAALKIGRLRIFGDRVGDAEKSDIKAVTAAGGKYVIDQYEHSGGNFNHYIDYNVIAKMIRTMVLKENTSSVNKRRLLP